MKEIELKRYYSKDEIKHRAKTSVLDSDFDLVVKDECILKEDGKIIGVYIKLKEDTSDIIKVLKKIKYEKGKRLRGLTSTSRIFGFRPRLTIRADYCSATSLAIEMPKEHAIICKYAKIVDEMYRKFLPKEYKKHRKIIDENVLKEYQIEGTVFTSGIINENNQLHHHFDNGNFKNTMNAMMTFKHQVEGGYLVLPEYRVALAVDNSTFSIFNAQSILHGVSKFQLKNNNSFRYTMVFYSLNQMKNCLPPAEEIARVRRKKTERELKRYEIPPEKRKDLISRIGKQ
ncbi:hypothetical protein [Persephonella sp.]